MPQARNIIEGLLAGELEDYVRDDLTECLSLMTRKSPKFVARRSYPPLTPAQKEFARELRRQGMDINKIAHLIGTNHGRISEATNP